MPKRARTPSEDEERPAAKRTQAQKEYQGFRRLVLAEMVEFGPVGLSYKGRMAEVPRVY